MLAEGLQVALSSDAEMQAVLGTPAQRGGDSGIFPSQAPDEIRPPWIVFGQISGMPLQESFQGTGRLMTSRWRFSCYGSEYPQAKRLAIAVRNVLNGLNGILPGQNPSTQTAQVEGSWFRLEMDAPEEMEKGTIFGTHLDYLINFADLD